MDAFNVISGIASIGGAIFALWQATQAKQSAEFAKDIEKNIKHHRATSDISKLKEKAEYLLSQVSIYGHGGHQIKYQLADHDKNSELIQGFVLKVQECLDSFSGRTKKEIDALAQDIDDELKSFNAPGIIDADRKTSGRTIVAKVNMLNSKFKSSLDKKIEQGI
jgi:hypothetical protein